MLKRCWSVFIARNKEYFRDRVTLGWNFLFPLFIIIGFSVLFQRGGQEQYKIGVIPREAGISEKADALPQILKNLNLLKIIVFKDRNTGFEKLRYHKVDMIIERGSEPIRYWVSSSSPKGTIAESLLLQNFYDPGYMADKAVKQTVKGNQIAYIEWLFPGIIAMNMMFSGLYGVGYATVRYRKNGVLKRLKATPLTAFEYLAAQLVSRMFVILFSGITIYIGCALLLNFHCKGSYFDLLVMFMLGSASIVSVGMIIAARISSEELAEGLVTLITWPMMFLSEVWFSLEGAPEWVHKFALIFPLMHLTDGMRQIMNEGASLGELGFHITVLLSVTAVFIFFGSILFRWTKD